MNECYHILLSFLLKYFISPVRKIMRIRIRIIHQVLRTQIRKHLSLKLRAKLILSKLGKHLDVLIWKKSIAVIIILGLNKYDCLKFDPIDLRLGWFSVDCFKLFNFLPIKAYSWIKYFKYARRHYFILLTSTPLSL